MKHIVAIIDGTWVSAADDDTPFSNAYNLNWMLDNKACDGNSQIVFYSSGIGTDEGAEAYLAGATAKGIDNQVREAYINVCSNYRHYDQDGRPDKIYLFGFSRGAVVARALCAIISDFGILKPQFMDFFPVLWRKFTNPDPTQRRPLSERMTYQDVPIEFIGLFDCVFGNRNSKGIYYTLRFTEFGVPRNVRYAVHFLSLDDERRAFAPMLYDSVDPQSPYRTVLEQIWMPGVHSDIGGTYESNALGRISLLSMIDLVQQRTSLGFHPRSVDRMKTNISKTVQVNKESSLIWRMMSPRKYRRTCDPSCSYQYIHPVFDLLLKYKGKKADIYSPRVKSHSDLRQFQGFRTQDWHSLLFPDAEAEIIGPAQMEDGKP